MQRVLSAYGKLRHAVVRMAAGVIVLGMGCGIFAPVHAAESGTSAQDQGKSVAAAPGVPAAQPPASAADGGKTKPAAVKDAGAKKAAPKKKTAKKSAAKQSASGKKKNQTAKTKTPAVKPAAKSAAAGQKGGKASPTAKPAAAAKVKTAAKPAAAAKAKPAATTAATDAAANPPKFPASKVTPVSEKKGAQLPVAETWMPLVRRLNKDGIEMVYLRRMFGRMGDAYSHEPMGTKVKELFTYKFVEKPPRKTTGAKPSTSPPVYKSMVRPESIEKCKAYLETHKAAFARMEERYGVPREVVVGLLMVETRLGTYLGYNSSFWSLACMAAADTPDRVDATIQALPLPMTPEKDEWLAKILKERSTWAYKELLALIKHSRENGLDPLGMPGSMYGAVGICQFMPSNLPKYAVDGNGDGKADLFDPADAIPSVANYLKEHGWTGTDWKEKDRAGHHKTLKRYNKSNVYANTILAIADGIAAPPEPAATAVADAGKAAVKKEPAKAKSGAVKTAPKKAAKPAAKKSGSKARKKTAASSAQGGKKPAPKKAATQAKDSKAAKAGTLPPAGAAAPAASPAGSKPEQAAPATAG